MICLNSGTGLDANSPKIPIFLIVLLFIPLKRPHLGRAELIYGDRSAEVTQRNPSNSLVLTGPGLSIDIPEVC
jgi:hypothetical protein